MSEIAANENVNIEEIFGSKVFTLGKMKERLPEGVYKEVSGIMQKGGELSKKSADIVAGAMKDWAVENGATLYSLVPSPYRHNRRKARCLRNPSR